jgi:hypothetical protein
MTVPKCTSIWGHKFEARYSTHPGDYSVNKFRGTAQAYASMVEAHSDREYHHDICVRCGHVVEHKTPAKSTD